MNLEDHPYYPKWRQGDALRETGLADVTNRNGTFPYPEAVSMRRVQGLSAIGMTAIPFRLSTAEKPVQRHFPVPKRFQYGNTSWNGDANGQR